MEEMLTVKLKDGAKFKTIQAAILSHKLKTYDKVIERRRAVAQMYQDLLNDLEEIQLPPPPNKNPDHFDVYQNYEITADKRDELKNYLSEKYICTLVQWGGKGVHDFQNLGFTQLLPNTDTFFKRCIMLPMNLFISDDDIDYICKSIREFYRK